MYTLLSDALIEKPHVYLLPGVTRDTVETCSRLLQHNHEHYHVYFNREKHFHNHTTHHLLAALGLGASSNTLERIYEKQKQVQKPLLELHDRKEFDPKKCLGDDGYYHDYLAFFTKELESEKYRGNIEDFIEHYLFNEDYLTLIVGGAYHAFIHLGYALEFQSKIMAIEGLAMAAIDGASVKGVVDHLKQEPNENSGKTALEIIELIFNEHRFDDKVLYSDKATKTDELIKRGGGPLIAEYAQMWKCDLDDLRRAGVLVNAAVIRPKKAPQLDFFLMHATTSCLFVGIFVHSLKNRDNQVKFLRVKFAVDLFYYVARGRPKLNLNYLFNEYQPSIEHSYADAQNPWLPLVEKCLTHPDEHVPKTIRALIYAERFDGASKKDKIPYFKIAQMVMDTQFPADEKGWTHEGIGWEEYWNTVEDL